MQLTTEEDQYVHYSLPEYHSHYCIKNTRIDGQFVPKVQPMAMMELFLYFTLLLQTFTFKNEPGTSLNFDSDLGIPKTVKLYALVR
uniref:Uncharacterized protein n=1 Tax=Strigamia maritima TaxID=126957 RepID=T1IS35_STRMM